MRRLLPLLVAALLASACGDEPAPPRYPQDATAADLAENDRGVGLMGRFDFAEAVPVFEALAAAHPHWLDVQVNLAIARLNRSRPDADDLGTAARLLEAVLAADPDHERARYCRGILHLNAGQTAQALPWFERIAKEDPTSAHAAYFAGHCLHQEDRLEDALRWFEEARRRDTSLRSTYYGGFQVLRALGRDAEAQAWMEQYKALEHEIQAHLAEIKYSLMGPKAMARAIDPADYKPAPLPKGPSFEPRAALPIREAADASWARSDRALRASLTATDLDGDGRQDLLATGALEPDGRTAVLLAADGGFRLVADHPLSAVTGVRAALWGDYDGDALADVYLCCDGPNRLFRQVSAGQWQDVTESAKAAGSLRATRDGAFIDFDHDGDLDLLLLQEGAPLEVLVNRYDGTFMPLPKEAPWPLAPAPVVGIVPADLDRDRDVDLVLLHAKPPHQVLINDRLWRWHDGGEAFADLCAAPAAAGIAVDADADGQVELLLADSQRVTSWQPGEGGRWRSVARTDVPDSLGKAVTYGPRLAVLDAEGDGALDLLVTHGPQWHVVRIADGEILRRTPSDAAALDVRPVLLDPAQGEALVGFVPGQGPVVWQPGRGRHGFAALAFSGKHKESDQMRSNASGVGVRAAARVKGRWTVRSTYRSCSGPGQSLQPLAFGLGGERRIDFVDLLWSDGLVQTETLLDGGALTVVEETQRQTSSCPVLFAWDGQKYAFVTDLLGVGGVGFWVAPDTYAPPTPRETVLLPAGLLKPRDGELVLKLGEPMEEACYLDGAWLDVVDLPPGWDLTVDERMAVEGPAPTGAVRTYRTLLAPRRATDQGGRDVTADVRALDLRAAPAAALDHRFIGRTAEQVLTLAFDRPLDGLPGTPVLICDGWIEYPYAQTMFAAWQADAAFQAPTIEARAADGAWQVVLAQFGYPAGMPRESSVPLAGLPPGTTQLRLRTTQEIYWDRLAIAWPEDCPTARRQTLALGGATLAVTGFAKRTTHAQRRPHYDYAQRAPLWDARHQRGEYTELGDVRPLVAATDDAVVVFGPGEEVELRFAAPREPPPAGWTRRYVLRTTGWCKDMDLFTKDGETVGPLPRRDAGTPPAPERDALHARFNTRWRGGR